MRDAVLDDPRPILLGHDIFRDSSYGRAHPLAIPRVSAALDLIEALGWRDPARYRVGPTATAAQLTRFHHPDYIAALQRVEATQRATPEDGERFHIGRNGNPIYPEIFRRPAAAVGTAVLGAELLLAGARCVFTPVGGAHHGRADRAAGFCYVNDPVCAILRLLDGGAPRVFYLDLDAHHGDGVQDAFHGDARVLCLSIHEEGRWPRTGAVGDRAGGAACNLPVPPGMNDCELAFLMETVVAPLGRAFAAPYWVVQCGCDALADDPQSKQELSNRGFWSAVLTARALAPRMLALGGGGYNPWATVRCWAGLWGLLDGRAFPERLGGAAESLLRGLYWRRFADREPPEHWLTRLADSPRPGPVREAVRRLAGLALEDSAAAPYPWARA